MKRYSVNIPNSSFSHYSSTNHYYAYRTVGTVGANDAVLVFMWERNAETSWNNAEWVALPMQMYWGTGSCFITNTYSITNATSAQIQFTMRNSCGGAPYNPMTGTSSYKVFVIAGVPGKQVLDTIDATDYEAVCEAFGLDPN